TRVALISRNVGTGEAEADVISRAVDEFSFQAVVADRLLATAQAAALPIAGKILPGLINLDCDPVGTAWLYGLVPAGNIDGCGLICSWVSGRLTSNPLQAVCP
ncbi:MAG: hypothetical protein KDE34_25815, partial [Anaerolineales bacterium]|nr:hypothetical protein [Anaerolineales bacterium]